jgi:hypothetical protein
MQSYVSVGVSTLVVLMAAHRAAAEGDEARPTAFNQEEIARIDAELRAARRRDPRAARAQGGRPVLRELPGGSRWA